MHIDAFIEIVVIRSYFNKFYSYDNYINTQRGTAQAFLLFCSDASIGNIWILILFVYFYFRN